MCGSWASRSPLWSDLSGNGEGLDTNFRSTALFLIQLPSSALDTALWRIWREDGVGGVHNDQAVMYSLWLSASNVYSDGLCVEVDWG